ncbi:MAG: hypothetical protein EOP45_21140 [Sphingobacteriaceae bacterium]|nr:MAG: hypothetical protein EOP45_21140 [Sphingobacteriaceae bacterium]
MRVVYQRSYTVFIPYTIIYKLKKSTIMVQASQNDEFYQELMSTQNRDIILQGVPWWGVTEKSKENVMGHMLQDVRERLQHSTQ